LPLASLCGDSGGIENFFWGNRMSSVPELYYLAYNSSVAQG
jgi:hypothetical protein